MTEALPCIVCGKALERVGLDTNETQPYRGTNFSSDGHYGSTVFDPMDGSFISLNVCDPCLTRAAEQGRVVAGRSARPVIAPWVVGDRVMDVEIGYEEVSNQALVPWHPGLAGFEDTCQLELDDLERGLPKTVHITRGIELPAYIAELKAFYAQESET